ETDPRLLIPCPIGMEEGVSVGIGMNAGFPFIVNVGVTGTAGLRLEARQAFGDLLKWNRMRIVRSESEDDGRLHFRVVQIREAAEDDESDQDSLEPPHCTLLRAESDLVSVRVSQRNLTFKGRIHLRYTTDVRNSKPQQGAPSSSDQAAILGQISL